MKKIFKKIINAITYIPKKIWKYTQTDMGWMGFPIQWIASDKQKHGVLAYWILTVSFFLMIQFFNNDFNETEIWKEIAYVNLGAGLSTLVGYIIEQFQKKNPNRHYDIKDITIMTKASYGLGIFWILVRQLTYNIF